MVCTALSAAPLLHGAPVLQGRNSIPKGFINLKNSVLENMPVSLSHLKYFGMEKGVKIHLVTASINSEVCLDLMGQSCIYPVYKSTARNIAVYPFSDLGNEGMMSQDQVVLGLKMRFVC